MTAPRILCIDDTPAVCRSLRLTLRTLGEVEVVTSDEPDAMLRAYSTSLEGIRAIIDDRPDVVVLDGLEGHHTEVLRVARDLDVPVVAYTASPELFRDEAAPVPVVAKMDVGGLLRALRAVLAADAAPGEA